MKQVKVEPEVDFIGGAGPLTQEEERQISAFINSKKQKSSSKKRSAQHGLGKKAGVKTNTHR
jgi:hypothetical protein